MTELQWAILHVIYNFLILIGCIMYSVMIFIGLVMYWIEKHG